MGRSSRWIWPAAVLCLGVATLAPGQDLAFLVDGAYGVGDTPRAIVAGDFDGDGRLDLATANAYGDSVSVLLNQIEYQGFAPQIEISVGIEPTGLATGDFNGDGHLDLVSSNSMSDDFSVVLGDGEGGFEVYGTYPAGQLPRSVVAGDFDGDGDQDLAITNALSPSVSIHRGDDTGAFEEIITLSAGTYPHQIASRDLDGNGTVDLAVASMDNNALYVFSGIGNGGFSLNQVLSGTGGNNIAIGDVNGDGHLDLVGGGEIVFSNMTVLHGNGDGTFNTGGVYQYDFGGNLHYTTGDFNLDGLSDICTSSYGTSYCYMYEGQTTGIQEAGDYYMDDGAVAMVTGDFDVDGLVDVAVADYWDSEVQIIRNITPISTAPEFIRGDATGDGFIQLGDPIEMLSYLFVTPADPFGNEPDRCLDAYDVDDTSSINLVDPMTVLSYIFMNGPPPAAPFPACGTDIGGLGCDAITACP